MCRSQLMEPRRFFKKPDYDLNVIRYADSHKAPFALAEFLTFNAMDLEPRDFKGKAMVHGMAHSRQALTNGGQQVIAGQHDFIFCTGQ